MATHKLESRSPESNFHGWIYTCEAFWILTWLLCILLLILACVRSPNQTEPKPKLQWISWFKASMAAWTVFLTSEALTFILISVTNNMDSSASEDSPTHKRLFNATIYLRPVGEFLRDAALVPVFITLLYLGLDITEAQSRPVRRSSGVVLKTWGFLLAGVLFALVVVDFGLIIEVLRLQLLDQEAFILEGVDPYVKRINHLARILKPLDITIVVLFEVAALTSLIWAILVAVRGRSDSNKTPKVVRYFLVSCVLFLLERSYPLVTTLRSYLEPRREYRTSTLFLELVFEGWPVTIVLMLLLALRKERLAGSLWY